MRLTRIYHPGPLIAGTRLNLTESAGHHLVHVLRCHLGQALVIFNGEGQDYPVTITALKKTQVEVELGEAKTVATEGECYLHLAQALIRSDKMDWILQKSVELGVKEITPLLTERCGQRLNKTQLAKKAEHWQAIIINAAEQCGRARLPQLNPAVDFSDWLSQVSTTQRLIASLSTVTPLRKITIAAHEPVTVLIGPEGGFSDSELAKSEQQNFQAFSLGPRVLRTETAALATLSILQAFYEGNTDGE